ncbi:glycosyltransferase [Chloroflexia bacterium SDU3-3]|nr:glycosyltransferase [Chloroflexia bacterium SDU3-3]
MNILLLSPYAPYPPYGGGTMRIYQIARGLARRHRVTCLTFAADARAERGLAPFRDVCRTLVVRGPDDRSLARRAVSTALSPLPDMALRNASASYAQALRDLLAREHFDIVQAESIEMAPYLDIVRQVADAAGHRRPICAFDQFNAEYVIQKRAAITSFDALRRGALSPRNLAGAAYSTVQWAKLARYERRAIAQADVVFAVSDDDRATMQALAPHSTIQVAPNGVDTTVFSRAQLEHDRAGALSFGPPTLVFSGTLDYRPNVDAALWFVRQVLPRIHAQRPDVRLVLIGRRPAPALQALPPQLVTLVGEVADARPYIAGASVYIVPMRIGGGVRLKLLEALALAAPVVSTAMGAEGVAGLVGGEHCLLADSPDEFAQATLRLLDDPLLGRCLGAEGRRLVCETYDWEAIIPQFEAGYRQL